MATEKQLYVLPEDKIPSIHDDHSSADCWIEIYYDDLYLTSIHSGKVYVEKDCLTDRDASPTFSLRDILTETDTLMAYRPSNVSKIAIFRYNTYVFSRDNTEHTCSMGIFYSLDRLNPDKPSSENMYCCVTTLPGDTPTTTHTVSCIRHLFPSVNVEWSEDLHLLATKSVVSPELPQCLQIPDCCCEDEVLYFDNEYNEGYDS